MKRLKGEGSSHGPIEDNLVRSEDALSDSVSVPFNGRLPRYPVSSASDHSLTVLSTQDSMRQPSRQMPVSSANVDYEAPREQCNSTPAV